MQTNTTPPQGTRVNNLASRGWMMRLVRLPSVERGCAGKANLGRSYTQQADRLSKKHGKRYGVYACPHCGGNHLTTKLEKSDHYADLLHISEPNDERTHPLPGAPRRNQDEGSNHDENPNKGAGSGLL